MIFSTPGRSRPNDVIGGGYRPDATRLSSTFPKPDLGHADTISITVRVRRASWNAMKPRIQCVLTQSNPGSSAS